MLVCYLLFQISGSGYASFDTPYTAEGFNSFPTTQNLIGPLFAATELCDNCTIYFHKYIATDSQTNTQTILSNAGTQISDLLGSSHIISPTEAYVITWEGTITQGTTATACPADLVSFFGANIV